VSTPAITTTPQKTTTNRVSLLGNIEKSRHLYPNGCGLFGNNNTIGGGGGGGGGELILWQFIHHIFLQMKQG
jgi:hypothetical protein